MCLRESTLAQSHEVMRSQSTMTTDATLNVERLDEAFLIAMFDRGGWVADRQSMSQEELKDLRSQFHHPIKMPTSELDVWLNHFFASFYYMLAFIRENEVGADRTTRVSQVRNEIRDLVESFGGLAASDVDPLRGRIQKRISELSEQAKGVLDFSGLVLKPVVIPKSSQMRSGHVSDEDFVQFLEHCSKTEALLSAQVGRGPAGSPVLKQMCRALAQLYLDATGEIPKRWTDQRKPDGEPEDAGPLLVLARAFERKLNAALPQELRHAAAPSLAKICRQASEGHCQGNLSLNLCARVTP